MQNLPIINTHPQPDGTFVTKGEHTLTRRHPPDPIVDPRVTLGAVIQGFGQMHMTCIYHSSITQSGFPALENPPDPPVHPQPLPDLFMSPQLHLFQNVLELESSNA